MITFIVEYWLECLCGILTTGMVAWVKSLQKKLEKKLEEKQAELEMKEAEQAALKSGMIALLHNSLHRICNEYLALGYIPVDDAEEIFDNTKMIYEAYHGLGGNGTGTAIYEKFLNLPVRNP